MVDVYKNNHYREEDYVLNEEDMLPPVQPEIHTHDAETKELINLLNARVIENPDSTGWHNSHIYGEDAPLTDRMKRRIDELFETIPLDSYHTSRCSCGIYGRRDIFDTISLANIRVDVLEYLIERNHFDLANDKIRNRIFEKFCKLLSSVGAINIDGMDKRIDRLIDFMFHWFEKFNPVDLLLYHEDGITTFHCAFYGHVTEKCNSNVKKLLDMHDRHLAEEIITPRFSKGSSFKVCQNLLFLSAINGEKELVKRFLEKGVPTDTYYDQFNPDRFEPLIASIIHSIRNIDTKADEDIQYLTSVTECIKILIDAKTDLHPLIVFKDGRVLSLGDYYSWYSGKYPDSPVTEYLSTVEIPDPLNNDGSVCLEIFS